MLFTKKKLEPTKGAWGSFLLGGQGVILELFYVLNFLLFSFQNRLKMTQLDKIWAKNQKIIFGPPSSPDQALMAIFMRGHYNSLLFLFENDIDR